MTVKDLKDADVWIRFVRSKVVLAPRRFYVLRVGWEIQEKQQEPLTLAI